jgi:hypothetical protein
MTTHILGLLKFWKIGLGVLLVLVVMGAVYLAHHRGEKLERLQKDYAALQKTHHAQISAFEKAYQIERERHDFKTMQDRKFRKAGNDKVQFDDALRSAYDSLRERQSGGAAR